MPLTIEQAAAILINELAPYGFSKPECESMAHDLVNSEILTSESDVLRLAHQLAEQVSSYLPQ